MASSPAKRWSTIVSRDHGWREFNPSHNGLGFIRNRSLFGTGDLPDLIIMKHPDIVIITLGLNDNFAFPIRRTSSTPRSAPTSPDSSTPCPTRASSWSNRSGTPVTGHPRWTSGGRVKTAAAEIHADYILGASHWIEHHPEWVATTACTPTTPATPRSRSGWMPRSRR
jgi:hypothetical protein